MTNKKHKELVLCVAPTSRGFGYAVFEGHLSLIDWGVKQVFGQKNRQIAERVWELSRRFQPDTLVMRADTTAARRRATRLTRLPRILKAASDEFAAEFVAVTRADIQERFAQVDAQTKHEIAQVVAQQHPELEIWLPPKRKIWMSEDPRLAIFDAAAAGEVHFRWRWGAGD